MEPVTGWIDPAWVQRQLHEIRGVADEAEVRVREKALWEAVLAASARRTCENPIECARLALTSKRTLDLEAPSNKEERLAALFRQLLGRHHDDRDRPPRLVPADLRGVREMFSAMKRGEAIGFLPDQVPGVGEGEWSEFFGRPAYTMTLAAKLASRDNVACFLAFAKRLPRGAGYALVLRPFPEFLPGETATRRLNRALEELVRECPEQYLWGYNRYKTPEGAKPLPA